MIVMETVVLTKHISVGTVSTTLILAEDSLNCGFETVKKPSQYKNIDATMDKMVLFLGQWFLPHLGLCNATSRRKCQGTDEIWSVLERLHDDIKRGKGAYYTNVA
jgi:hypothetical protein